MPGPSDDNARQVVQRRAIQEHTTAEVTASSHALRADTNDGDRNVDRGQARQVGGLDVRHVRSDDEGEGGDAGTLRHGLAHAARQVAEGTSLHLGEGVQQAHGDAGRQPPLGRRQRHGARFAQVRQSQGAGDGNRGLKSVVVPRVARRIQHDDVVGAVRLLVLAHDELAQTRRRLPVHGAAVITRLVVTQRVEGHV